MTETNGTTNPIFGPNRLKLGLFGLNGKGVANTLVPEAHTPTWEKNLRAAQLADWAGLDAIVAYARWKGHRLGDPDHPSGVVLDPFTWAAGIAQATEHCAVFATSHAPTVHPIAAAKMGATVDAISGGRFGLNVVAGWNRPELEMFGAPFKEHDQRYEHLSEWLDVVRRIWTEDEEFDFEGEFFRLVAGSSRPRPQQQPHPPIMSAGSSTAGRDFALRNAALCFLSLTSSDPQQWRAQVDAYKNAARDDHGREIQVWVMATIVQRDTPAEAQAYLRHFAVDRADGESVDAWMAERSINSEGISTDALETLRLRAAAGAGGSILCGDADGITDQLAELSAAGIDGVLIGYVDFEDGLRRLTDSVLPRLEARGLRQ